jgi:hypothetical protein
VQVNGVSSARQTTSHLAGTRVVRSVKDFGAVGDGRADDTAALNQAIQAVSRAGGGTVNLFAGTFKVSIPAGSPYGGPAVVLAPNVRLQGNYAVVSGQPTWRSTIRLADGQGDYSAILGPANLWSDLTGFAMDGVAVDGNRQGNPPTAALADYSDPIHKRDCLMATGGDGISVTNCKFANIDTLNAVALYSSFSRVTNARVANCLVRDVGGAVDHDTSFIRVKGDGTVIENNRVLGSAAVQGCWAAYEVMGSNTTFRNNYAEQVQFGCQVTGNGADGNGQAYDGNTFVDVLTGFCFWPFEPNPTPAKMQNVRLSNNTITVNRGLWVKGSVAHASADYWHAAIDVLVMSDDMTSGVDGGTINGLVIRNNRINFVNPVTLYDGEEPEQAIRLVRCYLSQNAVTVTGLVIQGNTVTNCPSASPVVIGSGVQTPGDVRA